MKKGKTIDKTLLEMGEGAFWDEFMRRDRQERYVIVDEQGKVVMEGVELVKVKRKIVV